MLPDFKCSDALAKDIVIKARTKSIASRGVSVTNDKLDRKIEKMKLTNRSDTGVFAQILLLVRRQNKHRGIRLIQPGEPEWFNIKETCKLATDFCNEFQIGLKKGYTEYLQLGVNKMKQFSIHKFKTIHAAICNEYEATQIIEQDKTPHETEQCHDYYLAHISAKIGYSQGYKSNPEKYKYFIEAKDSAKELCITTKIYIAAQFAGFEWNDSIPDPAQLVGTKALDRVQKYAFEKGITLGEKKETINFKQIKSNKNA